MKKKHDIAPRQEGETEEDYTRRYNREKKRIQRKDNVRVGRGKRPGGMLKAKPARSRLTQEQWESLQPREGEDPKSLEYRRRYERERRAIMRSRDTDQERAARQRHYANQRATGYAAAKAWRAANPEKVRASQKRYDDKHPERRDLLKAWAEKNPERLKAAKQAGNEANRGLLAHYAAKWRRQARIATPSWADFEAIRLLYEEAQRLTLETGIPHHVDHIVPLQSKLVCGLHTEANLRVIAGVENVKKRNRLDYALIYSLYGANERGHLQ